MAQKSLNRTALAFLLLLALVVVLLPAAVMAQQGEDSIEHVVLPGESLYRIAARYGVPVQAIADANSITNPNYIQVGRRLTIPLGPGAGVQMHVVARGQTLSEIAQLYELSVEDIRLANDLIDPDNVYVGQRLFIPVIEPVGEAAPAAEATVEPAAEAEAGASEAAGDEVEAAVGDLAVLPGTEIAAMSVCPAGCAALSIISPTQNLTVTSPLAVSGFGIGFEQNLVVRVLDSGGAEIGLGQATISGTLGQVGSYTGVVSYTAPAETQFGRVQVYSESPRDGAIEQLTSVQVTLTGVAPVEEAVDEAVVQLAAALTGKDYKALESLMADAWTLTFYQSEGFRLKPEAAIAQLRKNYLAPGQVVVDPAVDALALLGEVAGLSADVGPVIFSTGWGPDQADDAFLLMMTGADGKLRWDGMLYVFDALRDYEVE